MINVKCPSCSSPYDLDESRLPAQGLKMKCPKCEAKFLVKPDGEVVTSADAPKAAGMPAGMGGTGPKQGPGAGPKPPAVRKATMVGVAPPLPAGTGGAAGAAAAAPPPMPAPPKAPKAPPSGVAGKSTLAGGGLDDLPAPKKPASNTVAMGTPAAPDFGIDLPAPKAAPKPAAPPSLNIDLPAPKAKPSLADLDDNLDLGIDLPAPKAMKAAPPPLDIDLPAPKRAPAASIDLPAPKRSAGGTSPFAEIDLPAPKSTQGFTDLPVPVHAGLPQADDGVDLPTPKSTFGEEEDLPISKAGRDLPRVKDTQGGFGDLDLPISKASKDLPAPKHGNSAFGSLDLGFGSSDDIALDSTMAGVGGPDMGPNLDLPDLPDPEEMTRDGRAGAGGVSFGELDLGDGPSEPTPGMELDLPLEAPPEEPTGHAAPTAVDGDALQIDEGAIEASRVAIEADKQKRTVAARAAGATGAPRQSRRDLRKVFAVIGVMTVVVVVAGGYFLSYTPYGLFGQYALERYTGAIGTPAAAQKALKDAERALTLDTLPDSRRAARIMSNARQAAGVNRSLLVNSVAIEALHLQRFDDKKFGGEERISKLMDRIEKRQRDTPHLPLAAAGEKLVKRDFKGALASAKAEKSLLGYLLQAEALIALKRPADAQKAFELAKKAGGGAWAEWGIARTLMDGESPEALEAAVDATLAASPNHAEARVEKARLLRAAGKLDEAMALLVEVTASEKKKNKLGASMRTQSAAWTVIGSLFELERNRTKARAAYEKATALDSDNAEALVASGRVMLLDNRPEDALAQFDMVMRAGDDVPLHAKDARPLSAEAKLGAVEALIELQREQEALAIVSELTKQRPQDPVVMLWLGKTEAAANDLANAETHYREAISLDKTSFIGYMALAELFFEKNEPEKAAVVLEQATKEVSDNVEVQRMLGESELQRNHIPEAIARFQQALAISPNDTDTLFSLGVAQRRGGFLDDAATTLDRVMKLDSSWPGLATERGRVFEAQGQSEAAVKMYSDALVDTPEDIDLKLRLGAAQVLAGRMDEAEKILLEVNSLMARSGEAEHFLGRVAFARGDLESASARFKRAIDLDPERGVYYAYYAWAELERGNLGMVQTQLNRAIELDPSYAESYWIRGRLELRTGAVKDALKDLKKAVGLKPTLYEAFANIAEAQSQLRHVPDAMAAYKTALAGKPRRGDWWLELGKLYLNSDHRPDASRAFATAVELGEDHLRKQQQMPIWLPDALRWRAEAARLGGEMSLVKQSLVRYLEIAPRDVPDKAEIRKTLRKMGVTPPEE